MKEKKARGRGSPPGKASATHTGRSRAASPGTKGSATRISSRRNSATTDSSLTPPLYAESLPLTNRPKWDDKPLRNPPGMLSGLRPMTKEPWMDVAVADLAARMEFGSRAALGLADDEPLFEYNGFVEEARRRRLARVVPAVAPCL